MRGSKVKKTDLIKSQRYLNAMIDWLLKHLQIDTYDFKTSTELQVF